MNKLMCLALIILPLSTMADDEEPIRLESKIVGDN